MRKRTRSPLGFSMNPKRFEGVGLVEGLEIEKVEPDEGGSLWVELPSGRW